MLVPRCRGETVAGIGGDSCCRCHRPVSSIHDRTVRRVRERGILQWRVWLDVPVRRLRCSSCCINSSIVSKLA
ncbi:hypothetical protein F9883_08555 [Morganella morganii]|nr:hypothetical protein [Morganella morganii]